MIAPATLDAQSAHIDPFRNRTPLEDELFRDVEAALPAPLRSAAARLSGRIIIEKFARKMLNRFVRIAIARRGRRRASSQNRA